MPSHTTIVATPRMKASGHLADASSELSLLCHNDGVGRPPAAAQGRRGRRGRQRWIDDGRPAGAARRSQAPKGSASARRKEEDATAKAEGSARPKRWRRWRCCVCARVFSVWPGRSHQARLPTASLPGCVPGCRQARRHYGWHRPTSAAGWRELASTTSESEGGQPGRQRQRQRQAA
jgi:hypothetical protein